MERYSPKVQAAEERALLEQEAEFRAEILLEESVRIRHVIFGTFPCVLITSLNQDAHLVINADSDTLKLMDSPAKKSKKSGVKVSVALLNNSLQFGCVSQDCYRREAIYGNGTFSKGAWHHIIIRERKGSSRGVFESANFMSAARAIPSARRGH